MNASVFQRAFFIILGALALYGIYDSGQAPETTPIDHPDGEAPTPVLLERLQDADADVRFHARMALLARGEPAVPRLIELVNGENRAARLEAAALLGRIRRGARGPATPGLLRMLATGDAKEQRTAVETLRSIGPAARAAAPALMRILLERCEEARSENYLPYRFVPGALVAILGVDAVPFLIKHLGNPLFQVEIVDALARLGPDAFVAIPELKKMAQEDLPAATRLAVEEALERIAASGVNARYE